MCPLQSLLIDFNDTLFDHTHSVERGLLALRDHLPALRAVELDTLLSTYNRWLHIYCTQVLAGELTPEEARLRRFERILYSCGIPTADLDLPAAVSVYRAAYYNAERAVPGAQALLAAIAERGLSIAVVSNTATPQHLERLGLLPYVAALITPEQAGDPKPDAAIFREALSTLCVEPSAAVMVGDSWSQDVLGARRLGIRAVWFNRHHDPHPEPGRTSSLTSLHPLERALSIVIAGHPN
jgi:putative hydrolase of the HAD superfamily